MDQLQSVRVQRFKKITDAPFDLKGANILVGANNAGKNSIIQALHFGIGILQTIRLTQTLRQGATTLNPIQLFYSPSDSVYSLGNDGRLMEDQEQAIHIEYTLTSGESCVVRIRKGRNRNINVTVSDAKVADYLGNLENPFSIFSPGLAGIVKNEAYVSDGVLLRTLARGDANLVLRNILLRLRDRSEWDSFLQDLHDVFPTVELNVEFKTGTDEYIHVSVNTSGEWVPIELAGTGILQATQILSYIHYFNPAIIVLDEPDSHLHPNNQRLLCALLRRIAEGRETQVLLTTHSRHVVDALSSAANLLWVRDGIVEHAAQEDEVGILLDIGALDIKERVASEATKAVVLTEDEITTKLETVLQSNNFDEKRTAVLSYFGVTTIKNLKPLVGIIRGQNPKAKIVLHRDRDFYTEDEANSWSKEVRNLNVEPFLTQGTDIESHFVNATYLADVNTQCDESAFENIIEKAASDNADRLTESFINGRLDIARKNGTYGSLNVGQLATSATTEIQNNPHRYRHGKVMISAIRREFQKAHDCNLIEVPSEHLHDDALATIARKVNWG